MSEYDRLDEPELELVVVDRNHVRGETDHDKLMRAYERLNQKLDLILEKIRTSKAHNLQ